MSHSRKRHNAKLRQPLKRHGGKSYLAAKIIELMPPRCLNSNKPAKADSGWDHYCELFFGGGAVLLANDPEGISEVVNDIDQTLVNFWFVLRDERLFRRFKRQVEAMPCSRFEFDEAAKTLLENDDPVARAVAFFVRNRQSRQALEKDFATLSRERTRRGMNEQASAWLSSVEGLEEIHDRLKRVVILNDDAITVIKQQDGRRTLYYLDPPYLPQTRTVPDAYKHEMSIEDHTALLETLTTIKGRFLLSGYRSALYDEFAERHDWNRTDVVIDNKSGSGKTKQTRTECVWRNFV